MTMRDIQFSFTDTSSGAAFSLAGLTGTQLAPNSIDTAPLGAYLTELTANDTQLSANVNTYRDMGGGNRLWLCVDWVIAPTVSTSIDVQLITSASSTLSSPVIMYDFGVVAIAGLTGPTSYGKAVRQIAALPRSTAWLEWLGLQFVIAGSAVGVGSCVAWLGWDIDAVDLGGASGFGIK